MSEPQPRSQRPAKLRSPEGYRTPPLELPWQFDMAVFFGVAMMFLGALVAVLSFLGGAITAIPGITSGAVLMSFGVFILAFVSAMKTALRLLHHIRVGVEWQARKVR